MSLAIDNYYRLRYYYKNLENDLISCEFYIKTQCLQLVSGKKMTGLRFF
jgi:hypothetical protein